MARKKAKPKQPEPVFARVPPGLRPGDGLDAMSSRKLAERLRAAGSDVRPYDPFLGES